ncbi:hypothetical protein MMC25_001270 [Agyrium rufum]|nr:hypothetical protein [Agyrium rufum]
MDPFSVCLGVLTILGAAKKVCNGLIALKHAPREIEELRSALVNLTALLDRVAVTIQIAGQPESPNELLQLALDEATRVAEPLQSCLRELTSSNESSPLRKGFDRVVWSRKRGAIKDYVVRLVNVKAISSMLPVDSSQVLRGDVIHHIVALGDTNMVANPADDLNHHFSVSVPESAHIFEFSKDSIQANSFDACKFLIKAQGRPDLQTSASMTALDLAIVKVLTRAAEEENLIDLAELFKIPNGMKNQHFSRVHEIVLGLRAESLSEALHQDLAYLDKPDANGRTPLSWAAARADHEAVSILMDHLADVYLADVSGMTPLHYAATSNSIACMKLLLIDGADPSAKDKDRGWTPLHYAAFHQTDPSWVEELLFTERTSMSEQKISKHRWYWP